MSTELLPCPFCGGRAERLDFSHGDGDNAGGSCIICTRCDASGNIEFGRKENFIANWNRRDSDAAGGKGVPEGMELIAVNDQFEDLMARLSDFDRRGDMPDHIKEVFDWFEYKHLAAAPSPQESK